MLGGAFFQCSTSSGLFCLAIWFIFPLVFSILQPHGLSVGWSQLSLFQMFRKRHRRQRHTHIKETLKAWWLQEIHVCYFKASVIPYNYTYFQQLFGNHEFSCKERLLSMPISNDLFIHVNYELFGCSIITFKLSSFCIIYDSGI